MRDASGAAVSEAATTVRLSLREVERGEGEFKGSTVIARGAATGTYAVVGVTVTDADGTSTTLDAAGVAAVAEHATITVV